MSSALNRVVFFSLLHSQEEAAVEGRFSVPVPSPLGRVQRDFLMHTSCHSLGSDSIHLQDNHSF